MNKSNVFITINSKGGVGKTSTTHNLAASLALRNKRVLMIDLDPQSNLTQSCGCKQTESVFDAIVADESGLPICKVKPNLYICPSSMQLSSFERLEEPGKETILRSLIDNVRMDYDYILIDSQPSLNALTLSGLIAADKVLIPLQSQFLASHGLNHLLTIISKTRKRLNPSLEIGAIILTMFKKNTVLSREIASFASSNWSNLLFSTKIRDNIAIAESPAFHTDIFTSAPGSLGALDYNNLCSEFLERFENKLD